MPFSLEYSIQRISQHSGSPALPTGGDSVQSTSQVGDWSVKKNWNSPWLGI